MAKEKKIESILVSLDSLLDTRLGTIAKINPLAVDRILTTGEYHTREEDVFEGIDRTQYKKLYELRDVDTLKRSMLTNMVPLLKHLVGVLGEQAIARPYFDGVDIVINIYPYKLSKIEIDSIKNAVSIWLSNTVPISIVSISPKELVPIYCKSQYALMIMYDYGDWLELNAELFIKTQLPEITLFVPAIYFVNKPTKEEMEKLMREAQHPMKAIELLAKGIIALELIDIGYFSILNAGKEK